MYKIRQVAELTGFSPDTLRYYEKIGLIASPQRGAGGARLYSEENIRLVTSINCLKRTGLSLEDMKDFIENGQCIVNQSTRLGDDDIQTMTSRRQILAKHLNSRFCKKQGI